MTYIDLYEVEEVKMPTRALLLVFFVVQACLTHVVFAGGRPLPLKNDANEVRQAYDAMSTYTAPEQKAVYSALPKAMQADLWMAHIDRFLLTKRDLTAEQRGVVYEAIGMLAAGVLEIDRADPEWDTLVGQPLAHLRWRAEAAFGVDTAASLFAQLAPAVPLAQRRQLAVASEGWGDPCQCSTQDNWCDSVTNPTPNCRAGYCRPQEGGCGWWWQSDCDGMCGT